MLYYLISLGAVIMPTFILNANIIGKGGNVFWGIVFRVLLMALVWPGCLLMLVVLGISEGMERVWRWVRLYILK